MISSVQYNKTRPLHYDVIDKGKMTPLPFILYQQEQSSTHLSISFIITFHESAPSIMSQPHDILAKWNLKHCSLDNAQYVLLASPKGFIFGHSLHSSLTIRAMDAGMLVVTEEETLCALTLVAPHGVDTHLLASTVVVQTLIYIC